MNTLFTRTTTRTDPRVWNRTEFACSTSTSPTACHYSSGYLRDTIRHRPNFRSLKLLASRPRWSSRSRTSTTSTTTASVANQVLEVLRERQVLVIDAGVGIIPKTRCWPQLAQLLTGRPIHIWDEGLKFRRSWTAHAGVEEEELPPQSALQMSAVNDSDKVPSSLNQ